jgi:hypothetical protein
MWEVMGVFTTAPISTESKGSTGYYHTNTYFLNILKKSFNRCSEFKITSSKSINFTNSIKEAICQVCIVFGYDKEKVEKYMKSTKNIGSMTKKLYDKYNRKNGSSFDIDDSLDDIFGEKENINEIRKEGDDSFDYIKMVIKIPKGSSIDKMEIIKYSLLMKD